MGVLLLAAGESHAQPNEVLFDHLTLEDGLSQSEVTSMLQDRVGFMWFGTREGLNRYNGYEFVVHKSDPDDPATISDNFVTALCEPRFGRGWVMWVGTRNGLNRFDRDTGRFTRYLHDPADAQSISGDRIGTILEDRAGRLWIGTEDGLNLRLPQPPNAEERFVRFRHQPDDPDTLSSDVVTSLWEDRTSAATVIWVGTVSGLDRLEVRSGPDKTTPVVAITRYPRGAPEGDRLSSDGIQSLFQTQDGTLWVGANGEDFFSLRSFGGEARRHQAVEPGATNPPLMVTAFQESDGVLWIGTFGGGISLLRLRDGVMRTVRHRDGDHTSLSGNYVLDLFLDSAGRLWVGTSGAGVSAYSAQKRHFARLKREADNPRTLSHSSVLSVLETDDDTVWVGTVEGLNKYDRRSGVVRQFRHNPADPATLPSDIVFSVAAVPGSRGEALWVGTRDGLARLEVSSGRFRRFQHDERDPSSLSHNRVCTVLCDRRDRTWVGTDEGLDLFDPATDSFKSYVHDPMDPSSLVGKSVVHLFEDSRGLIWVATNAGISRFDPESGRFDNYRKSPDGLSDNWAYCFAETQGESGDQILWIGTRNGLSKFEVDQRRWSRYLETDGLPSEVVVGVLPDGRGNLWLSTFRGLVLFEPTKGTFRSFRPDDGLQSYEFNFGAYHRGRSGRLYFGGIEGLNWIEPDRLAFNSIPPPVVLTSFKVFNREIELGQALSTLREIELRHDQNTLSFEFAALDYTIPEQNRYRYRMEGVDPDWIDSGHRRYASYTEMSPGSYRFRVEGSNNDGVWNQQGLVLDIRIAPPLWATWWAYLLYGVGGFSLAFLVERSRLRRLRLAAELRVQRLEAEKLAELDRLKTRFFTDVTHEFRTPLTLIQGSLQRLPEGSVPHAGDLERIRINADRLVGLIDQMLDLARIEVGKAVFQPSVQDLAEFTRFVVSCFSSLAETRGIELSCHTPDESVAVDFDRSQLEKCFSNLLSNALKFTPSGGAVLVTLRCLSATPGFEHGRAEFEVVDTGVGIPKEELERVFDRFHQAPASSVGQQGSGIGLALTRELVFLHGGEIQAGPVEDKRGSSGARVTIRLPLAPVGRLGGSTDETTAMDWAGDPRPAAEPDTEEQPELLVVEDHPDMRRFLQEALEPEWRVQTARDGAEGFARATHSPPELIVSDVLMPGFDGLELCAKLRGDERTSHIPIILLTAKAGESSRIQGLESGADDYLTKPFSQAELRTRIRNLIAQRERLREKYTRRIQLDPKDITITSTDELFLRRVMATVERELPDFDFGVAELASLIGLSRVQLHRKLRALTGETPTEFIRTTRLRLAAKLLAGGTLNVTEAAFEVGFNNLSYFAKCFRDRFGVSPSIYAKNPTEETTRR